MAKLSRLIRLINLLSGSQPVSLEKICSVCNIAPRTAYRYLTDISEATVPVYYDRDQEGYRLLLPQHLKLDHLTLTESVLVICALSFMCRHVNELYRRDFIRLIEKIQSTDCALVGEVLANLEDVTTTSVSRPDYSDRLTTSLIELAIANRWSLRLESKTATRSGRKIEFSRPRLRYSQGWVVEDESMLPIEVQDLKSISKVDIV